MDFLTLYGYWPSLLKGFLVTLEMGLLALAGAIIFGLIGASLKLRNSRLSKIFGGLYTNMIRGIPELVLIFGIYYLMPEVINAVFNTSIVLNSFLTGVFVLSFVYGAFATEVIRGAFLSIPKGQQEAAYALGMDKRKVFRRILVPQMWRYALPGLGNLWMVLIKGTSLTSIIGLKELLGRVQDATGATHNLVAFYFWGLVLYLLITGASMLLIPRLETYFNRGIELG